MTTVSLRFDDEMKRQLDEMCDEMGMNLTTFFMIYAKKALRDRRIPFEITAPLDPFYSDFNMEQLRKANQQVKKGQVIVKTMEELESLEPITIQEAYADKEEMGTITLKTNRTDLNAFQVYSIYKQRQAIEQFFKTYGDTMSYEASYMRNNYTEEAWLFLNHLSTIIGVNAIEEIASIGESKNISYKDLAQTLIKIKAGKMDGKWVVYPIKKSVQRLCEKMQFNPNDLTALKL